MILVLKLVIGSVLVLVTGTGNGNVPCPSASGPRDTELPPAVRPCPGVGKIQLQHEIAWQDRWSEA